MKSTTTDTTDLAAVVSVQRLAEARGVELVEHEGRLAAQCPFHDNGTVATLVIDPNTNTWSCSVCAVSGGVIEWVMKAEGVSRTHAVELLRADKLTGGTGIGRRSSVRKLEPFVPLDSPDDVVMSRVIEFYAEALRQDVAASEFLRMRKLDNAELMQHFRLGYGVATSNQPCRRLRRGRQDRQAYSTRGSTSASRRRSPGLRRTRSSLRASRRSIFLRC